MTITSTTFSPFSPFGGMSAAASVSPLAASSETGLGVGAVGDGTVDTLARTGTTSLYGLSTDDFMKLFLAQLQNQDPTKPMDDSQMLSQLSQMTQVQTLQGVQAALEGSQLAQSSALIGKNVTGLDVNGDAVSGIVTSVVQSNDAGLVLQVGSQYIKPGSITVVTGPTP